MNLSELTKGAEDNLYSASSNVSPEDGDAVSCKSDLTITLPASGQVKVKANGNVVTVNPGNFTVTGFSTFSHDGSNWKEYQWR